MIIGALNAACCVDFYRVGPIHGGKSYSVVSCY